MWRFSSLFCFLHLFIPVPDKQNANMLEDSSKIVRQLPQIKYCQTYSQIAMITFLQQKKNTKDVNR